MLLAENFFSNFFNYRVYRSRIAPLYFKFSTLPVSYWLMEDNQRAFFFGQPLHFISRLSSRKLIHSFFKKFFEHFSIFSSFFRFRWFRFVLFSGLGYKRRFFAKLGVILVYTADRHWIIYKFHKPSTVIPTKKRNFIFFSLSKGGFSTDYGFFSDLRNPYVYKTKGFLDRRIRRRFLFARRIRLRSVKTKLSKKQQML